MSRHALITAFIGGATHVWSQSCVAPYKFGGVHVSRHTRFALFMCRATQVWRRSCVTPHKFRRIHVLSYDGRLEGIHFRKHSVGYLRVNNDTQKGKILNIESNTKYDQWHSIATQCTDVRRRWASALLHSDGLGFKSRFVHWIF